MMLSLQLRHQLRASLWIVPLLCVLASIAPLMKRILAGEIDPSFVITHRMALEEPAGLRDVPQQAGHCEKIVLSP